MGRRRNIPELHSRNKQQVALGERLAVNSVVQGSAADLIKKAMIDIHRSIRAKDRPSRLLIQVHDELVFEPGISSSAAPYHTQLMLIAHFLIAQPRVADANQRQFERMGRMARHAQGTGASR